MARFPAGRSRARTLVAVSAVVLVALLSAACSTSEATGPDSPVVGSWIWVRTTGGLIPTDRTPATEGYARTLVFGTTGVARLLQDGSEIGRVDYEVTVGAVGAPYEGVPIIRYSEPLVGFAEQAYDFVGPDSLVLRDGCCDGFDYHYARGGS